MKRLLLVLSLVAVIVTSTVLANPASALTEDVSGEVVQGLESGGNSGSGAQDPVEAADEQTNAQGNEAAPSSDPQETPAAPSADQGVMNANSVSAVDSAAVTENGTGDSGIAASGAEADGTKKSADQISAAEGSGTAEQGATLAEAAETVSTEEAAADKTIADDRAQVKIARKDGTGFPSDTTMSGSPLGTDDWNRVLSAVSSKVKAQSDDSTAYSVAGLHTEMAALHLTMISGRRPSFRAASMMQAMPRKQVRKRRTEQTVPLLRRQAMRPPGGSMPFPAIPSPTRSKII